MNIKSLEVKNFQVHKELTLNFHPGITAIKGPSDAGKSSIFRALYWVGANADLGAGVATHHTANTSATINERVTKRRKAGKLSYELDGDSYANVARGKTPEEVAAALNLTADNFQGQHDVYFLIGDSAGQVARKLNEVADLKIIDEARKKAKEAEKGMVLDVKSHQDHLDEALGNIRQLSWVELAEKSLSEVETAMKKLYETEQALAALSSAAEKVSVAQESVIKFPENIASDQELLAALGSKIKKAGEDVIDKAVATTTKFAGGLIPVKVTSGIDRALAQLETLVAAENDKLEKALAKASTFKDQLIPVNPSKSIGSAEALIDALVKSASDPAVTTAASRAKTAMGQVISVAESLGPDLIKVKTLAANWGKANSVTENIGKAVFKTEGLFSSVQLFPKVNLLEDVSCCKGILSRSTEVDGQWRELDLVIAPVEGLKLQAKEATVAEAQGKEDYDAKVKEMGTCPLCHGELH